MYMAGGCSLINYFAKSNESIKGTIVYWNQHWSRFMTANQCEIAFTQQFNKQDIKIEYNIQNR